MDEIDLSKTVAVVLAGGQGSRMFELTRAECKPALPFADRHRIVDFTMASLRRSGMRRVMVATQYPPQTLSAHLRDHWAPLFGAAALTEREGQLRRPGTGYAGTADVLRANAEALDALDAEEVLVVAADHVYAMDYRPFIARHRASGAALTLAAMPVPLTEASRFGVVDEGPSGQIAGFAEKPPHPAAMADDPSRGLASLGIYVIDWRWLRATLRNAALVDFGHDVIPLAVDQGVAAVWRWRGYWRDVGTLSGLRQSWLDFQQGADPCLRPDALNSAEGPGPALGVLPEDGAPARLADPLPANRVWRAARLDASVLMPGARLSPGVRLRNVVVAPGAQVPLGLNIGHDPEEDSRWFRISGDTTLVTPAMLARRRAEKTPLYSLYQPAREGGFNMSRPS